MLELIFPFITAILMFVVYFLGRADGSREAVDIFNEIAKFYLADEAKK